MSKVYSEAARGFYLLDMRFDYLAAGSWPADGVEVSAADEQAIRAALLRDDAVNLDGNRQWVFTPAPPAPFAPIAAAYLDSIRVAREQVLNRLAGIGLAALLAGDNAEAQAVATARQKLLDIPTAPAVLAATDVAGLKAAMFAAYSAIVETAPATLVKAFDVAGL